MDEAEFDKFADEYKQRTEDVLGASGEDADFFAEYKVKDTARIIKAYDLPEDIRILDFGSGIGESVPFFLKHMSSSRLTCIDVSEKSLKIGSERFKGKVDFIHFDGKKIPFKNASFDVVFTACVFHHIPPEAHQSLIHEIHRILKPGGIFIAFEHNPYNFLTVRAVYACSYDENAILIRAADFRDKLCSSGLVNEKLHYRIFFPRRLRLLRPLEKVMCWLPLGAQYYVCAQKPA